MAADHRRAERGQQPAQPISERGQPRPASSPTPTCSASTAFRRHRPAGGRLARQRSDARGLVSERHRAGRPGRPILSAPQDNDWCPSGRGCATRSRTSSAALTFTPTSMARPDVPVRGSTHRNLATRVCRRDRRRPASGCYRVTAGISIRLSIPYHVLRPAGAAATRSRPISRRATRSRSAPTPRWGAYRLDAIARRDLADNQMISVRRRRHL